MTKSTKSTVLLQRLMPIGLLAVAAIALVTGTINSAAQAGGETQMRTLAKDFGSWKYTAKQVSNNGAEIYIAYDHTTIEGLVNFKQANQALAKQLQSEGAQRYDALVTFDRPLSLDEFTNLVADNDLNVKTYTMRMVASEGQRWTIFGSPEGGALVPEQRLDTQKKFILQNAPDATFRGVVDAEVSFDATRYDAVQNTAGVFLADITRTLAKQETMQNITGVAEQFISVDASHPYWFMEDLGLHNFK